MEKGGAGPAARVGNRRSKGAWDEGSNKNKEEKDDATMIALRIESSGSANACFEM